MAATNIVILKATEEKSGEWRKVVVKDGFTLFNLHRVVQYAFKKRPSDAAMERLKPQFSYQGAGGAGATWSKAGDLNRATLEDLDAAGQGSQGQGPPPSDASTRFLTGRVPLRLTVGKEAYSIVAGERGITRGAGLHYVPRCVAASGGGDVDPINRRLLVARFHSGQANNKQKRPLPKWMWYKGGPRLWPVYLNLMSNPDLD